MKITEKDVQYIAGLANLSLRGDEVPRLARDLDTIIAYIDQLNELDTTGVEPMSQVLTDTGGSAAWRADEPVRRLTNGEALANAPAAGAGCFKVPKVIER
mgnify:CR=1 FL=1